MIVWSEEVKSSSQCPRKLVCDVAVHTGWHGSLGVDWTGWCMEDRLGCNMTVFEHITELQSHLLQRKSIPYPDSMDLSSIVFRVSGILLVMND